MKTLACREVGLDCDNIIKGTTKEVFLNMLKNMLGNFML
jgi:hypothetical protein